MRRGLVLATIVIVIVAVPFVPACKEAAPTLLSASEIIDNSVESMGAVNSFHFELKHVGGGTPIAKGLEMNEAMGDIAKPDKLKITITAAVAGMLVQTHVITVGKTTYMTNPFTQQWEPLPSEFSAISIFNPDTGIAATLKGMADFVKLDDEEVDAILCYHIKGKIPCESLRPITLSVVEGVKIDVEVWIDKEEFLLHQIKLEGKITEVEKPGIVRKIKLSNFNQEVEIELPK